MTTVTFDQPQPLVITGADTLLGYEITCATPTWGNCVVRVLDVTEAPGQEPQVHFERRAPRGKVGLTFTIPQSVFLETYTRNVISFTLLKKRG
jgi:hypothetical protein